MDQEAFDPAAIDRIHGIGGPDLVRKMAEIFYRNGAERTAAAAQGGLTGDLEAIERAVHSLRSSAGNLGARALQELCEDIEDLAASGTRDGIDDRLERLEPTFRQAEAWVRARLEELAK